MAGSALRLVLACGAVLAIAPAGEVPINEPWSFEQAKFVRIGTRDSRDLGGFDDKCMALDRSQGALATVYLPPGVKTYRGVWIDNQNGRYGTANFAEVLQFALIRHNWYFQDQLRKKSWDHEPATPVDKGWLQRALDDLAARSGHPEIAHAPILLSPKQFGDNSIVEYVTENMPGRLIAVAHGFGDAGRVAAKLGAPTTTAAEMRSGEGRGAVAGAKRQPGELTAPAGEWGFPMHWSNGKPHFGMLMFQQVVLARLPLDQFATRGPVQLKPLAEDAGWLGDLAVEVDKPWREISPANQFKGDRQRTAWLVDDVCATAWRGYMTPNPPVTIVSPNTPFGMSDSHVFLQSPLPAGAITIRFEPTVAPRGKWQATAVPPGAPLAPRVRKVDIMRGRTVLGSATAASGSITVDLGPGLHVIAPEVELDDGSRMGGWPTGVMVAGDIYADAMRSTIPAKLAAARGRGDLAQTIDLAQRALLVAKQGEPLHAEATAALADATAKADARIAAVIEGARRSPKAKPLDEAIAQWSPYEAGTARLRAAREEIAAAAWTASAAKTQARALVAFLDEWQGSAAAAEALAAYDALAKAASVKDAPAQQDGQRAFQLARFVKEWDRRAPTVIAARAEYETVAARLLATAQAAADPRARLALLAELAQRHPTTKAGAEAAALAKQAPKR